MSLYNNTRQELSDLRKSSEALDNFQDIGPQTKKNYRDTFIRQMIDKAETANLIAAAIKNAAP
jgi:hypothetical protein